MSWIGRSWTGSGKVQLQLFRKSCTSSTRSSPRHFCSGFGLIASPEGLSESLRYLQRIGALFVQELARTPDIEQLRGDVHVQLEEESAALLLAGAPFLAGSFLLDREWLAAVWSSLHRAFALSLERNGGSVAQLFSASGAAVHLAGRVYFHLVESKEGSEFPFSFLSTYSVEQQTPGKPRHLPLKNALIEYGENSSKLLELLATVHRAAEQSELINELLDAGDLFYPIGLTTEEAYIFLREVSLYEQAGIMCRIPNWWRSRSNSLKLNVSVGEQQPSRLNTEALLSFNAELWLGGESVTTEELRLLLAEEEGLALIKGRWVEVNHKRLKEALDAYERAQKAAGASE